MSAISKVVYGNQTLIDLTADTVEASKLLKGETAHTADGSIVTGTMPSLQEATEDATAVAAEILSGETAYVRKGKENENAILQSQANFVESVIDEYNALIEA